MTIDKKKGNHFHLLFEYLGQPSTTDDCSPASQQSPGFLPYLEIPNRLGYLTVEKNNAPRVTDGNGFDRENLYVVQPFWNHSKPALLLLSPGRQPPLINGLPAPPVALLHMKDEVLLCKSCRYAAHVTLFIRPRIGPPVDIDVGKNCPVCKTEFRPDAITYTCHFCGQILHCDTAAHLDQDHLNCANFCSNCPICLTPIRLEDGYAYLPEFFCKED